ncbi:MAG: helix-turn-helix transcriptional regulator [Oscillospiraceae bacterium]
MTAIVNRIPINLLHISLLGNKILLPKGAAMKTNLQHCRKAAGFKSAKAFAEHAGISVGSYTQYEQGQISLSLEKAWEFADLLDCSLDELAGRERPAKDYSDDRQAGINRDFGVLDEPSKDAAAAALRGMAAACAQSVGPKGSEAHKRTA